MRKACRLLGTLPSDRPRAHTKTVSGVKKQESGSAISMDHVDGVDYVDGVDSGFPVMREGVGLHRIYAPRPNAEHRTRKCADTPTRRYNASQTSTKISARD
jgi:hypothetical protein